MMERLLALGVRRAEQAAARRRAEIVDVAQEVLSEAVVAQEEHGVVVSGRHVAARWLADARLRFVGQWTR